MHSEKLTCKKKMIFLKYLLLFLLTAKNTHTTFPFVLETYVINPQINKDVNSAALVPLMETIEKERHVETVFVLTNNYENYLMDGLQEALRPWPMLRWHTNNIKLQFVFKTHYNKEILVLLILKESEFNIAETELNNIWYNLAKILNEMRHSTRILVYFSQQEYHEIMLLKLFEICGELKFLQIVALFKDFQSTELLYGFEPFAQNNIRVLNYVSQSNLQIYGNVLKNLNGQKIKSIADQIEPRSLLYIDDNGVQQLTGYVVNLINTFAYKHNATIIYPYPMHVGKVLFYGDVAEKTRAGLLDVPASLLTSTGLYDTTALLYPMEQMNYCLMVPLPPHKSVNEIYAIVIHIHVYLIELVMMIIYSTLILLNEHSPTYIDWTWKKFSIFKLEVVRVFCDQNIQHCVKVTGKMKFIYIQMIWFMFILNAMYSCYLGSLLTKPPHIANVKYLEDFPKRNMGIIVAESEWKLFILSNNDTNTIWHHALAEHILQLVGYREFLDRRKALITSHAYPVTSSRWYYFQEQQRIFERPLFYFDNNFCLANMVLLSIPVQNNSIYVEAINRVTLQIHQSGLMRKWLVQSFFDMVRLKRIPLDDLSPPLSYDGQLHKEDLGSLFIFLFTGVSAGFLTFICECHWVFIKSFWQKIKNKKFQFKKEKQHVKIIKKP